MKTVPLNDTAAPCPDSNPADEATPHRRQSGRVGGRHPNDELQWERQSGGQVGRLGDGHHSEGTPA
jgi:hypothetical protein